MPSPGWFFGKTLGRFALSRGGYQAAVNQGGTAYWGRLSGTSAANRFSLEYHSWTAAMKDAFLRMLPVSA